MALNKLTDTQVKRFRTPGRYGDGGGLYLEIKNGKRWIMRYLSPVTGKTRDMGLGSLDSVSLALARDLARKHRELIAEGIDPIDQRKDARAETRAQLARTRMPSFQACWDEWRREGQSGVTRKHANRQDRMVEMYALPILGKLSVDKIDTDEIVDMLTPIWRGRMETTRRMLRVVAQVMRYAKQRKYRTGDNPAEWKNLDSIFNYNHQSESLARVEPEDMPALMALLRDSTALGARCAEFAAHTLMRSTCVRETRWVEIDLPHRLWTVPKERMKVKGRTKDFLLPLSDRAVAILEEKAALRHNDYVFAGTWGGNHCLAETALRDAVYPLLDKHATVHGFRSAFRDWGDEQIRDDGTAMFGTDVLEYAIGHTVRSKVQRAYQRDEAYALRTPLMARWSAYLDGTL